MRGRFMEYVLKLDNISLDDYILGIADGDTKYLEKLYGATKTYVFGYAFSILKNINDSEDVMQDVFLNIYKNANFYSSKNKPMAWIITITRNLCLEKLRRKKKLMFDDISTVEHLLSKKDKKSHPALCRVYSYSSPGFPSPTTIFIKFTFFF